MNSPKKNFVYNILYQILVLIIPLITAPYIARVIGAEGTGIRSYTYSIAYYFMLVTKLGVNNYGNRSIAKVRDDKQSLSVTFWSIYSFQLIMGIAMLFAYLLYVFLFDDKFRVISLIQSFYIISAALDITWFFFGLEDFKKTIAISTVVRVINAVLIFLFVKTRTDLWKYALIMSGMTCLSQLVLWEFVRNKISFVKVTKEDIVKHIKPNFILFIPVIAVSLYKIMDKIMLGALTAISEVGFYENAERVIDIPLCAITALGTVMLPRMSNIIAKGKTEQVKEYISKSTEFIMFLSYAMALGLMAVGYKFAPLFFGKEFQKTGLLIILLSSTLPFISFANVLRTQYLIPNEQDKPYIKSIFLGAIVNLIVNFILIPKYQSIGACYGTIAAEISVMLYQSYIVGKALPVKKYFLCSLKYLLKACVMFICVYPLNYLDMNDLVRLIAQMALGGIIYGLLNFRYIFGMINIKKQEKQGE